MVSYCHHISLQVYLVNRTCLYLIESELNQISPISLFILYLLNPALKGLINLWMFSQILWWSRVHRSMIWSHHIGFLKPIWNQFLDIPLWVDCRKVPSRIWMIANILAALVKDFNFPRLSWLSLCLFVFSIFNFFFFGGGGVAEAPSLINGWIYEDVNSLLFFCLFWLCILIQFSWNNLLV